MIQWEWENEMISYQKNDHIEQEKIWCLIFSWEKQEKAKNQRKGRERRIVIMKFKKGIKINEAKGLCEWYTDLTE